MSNYEEKVQEIIQEPQHLETVNKWLVSNTYQCSDFSDLSELYFHKKDETISLVLPTLNEEQTIEFIVTKILDTLNKEFKIIDEIIVIDGGSTDNTVSIVERLCRKYDILQVINESEILPRLKHKKGKGNQLWKGLYYSSSSIVLYCDTDIRNFDVHMIYGLIGPLLTKNVKFIKGYYERPLIIGENIRKSNEGGRVTELCARPLLNLFYPELAGFIQPLGGEYGGYRELLENVEYTSGYGVEVNILIEILQKYGLSTMGQVDLLSREHRHQNTSALSKMSFIIMTTILRKNMNKNLHSDLLIKKFEKTTNKYEKNNIFGDSDVNDYFTLIQNVPDDTLPAIKTLIKQPVLTNNFII